MKKILAAAVAAAAIGVSGVPAHATAVLDQSNLTATSGFFFGAQIYDYGGSPYAEAGQTFTAGLSGILSQVNLLTNAETATNMTLWIRPVSGGIVDSNNSNALGSFSYLAPAWGPGFSYSTTSVDVSAANITMIAGQQYAITVSSTNPIYGGWAGPNDDTYAGGTGWGRSSDTAAWGSPIGIGDDLFFATFVNTSAVPEPATWAMMVLGFGVIGAAMRSRRGREAVPALV